MPVCKNKVKTLRSLDLGLLDTILQETLHQNATVVCVYIYIYICIQLLIYIYIYIHIIHIVSALCIFLHMLFFMSPPASLFKSVAGLFGVM